MSQIKKRQCLVCKTEIQGRSDKIFCDVYCKSNYQYQQIKSDNASLHHKITKQLRLNRKILKDHNKAGKATVRVTELIELGFNPRIFTHYWKNPNKKTYLFVYEYGFLKITNNKKEKYLLIKWQDYMYEQIGKI